MDSLALERAKQRIADAAAGRPEPGAIEAALERSRDQIEALAVAAAELEASIPAHVGVAVRDGLRIEVLPVARHIAEIRGLLNQAIRRLERLEGDLLAERHARVDDLALLVELVSSGWRGVDARLERLEASHDELGASRALAHVDEPERRAARVLEPRRRGLALPAPAAPAARAGTGFPSRRPTAARSRRRAPPRARARSAARGRFRPHPERRTPRRSALAGRRRHARARCRGRRPRPAPFACASWSSMRPPSGVQRKAFESRLVITWRTRSPSETITGARLDARQPVVDLASARLLGERTVCLIEDPLEVDLLVAHREAVGLELREVEDVADEALEPVGLGRDDVERRADLIGLARRRPREAPRRARGSRSAAS